MKRYFYYAELRTKDGRKCGCTFGTEDFETSRLVDAVIEHVKRQQPLYDPETMVIAVISLNAI